MSAIHIPMGSGSRPRFVVIAAVLAATMMATTGMAAEPEKGDKKSAQSQAELEQKLESARRRLDAAAREVADLSMSMSEDALTDIRQFTMARMHRAMLGINISSAGKADSEGVEIVSVSPGGAAADAGLKSGDVLLEANGKALKRDGNETPRDKLMGVMHDVKPGDKVAVSYRREGKVAKTTLAAKPLADRFFSMAVPAVPMSGAVGPGGVTSFGHFPNFAFMRADGVFGSAELVPLTPKLGQYFGTEKGLLVVRAPDGRLKLEDGDVIVDIDGRTPSSPSHALRILGSYQPGEKLQLNILRAKKKMSFDITIPEDTWASPVGAGFIRSEGMLMPGMPGAPVQGPMQRLPYPPANAIQIMRPAPDEEA